MSDSPELSQVVIAGVGQTTVGEHYECSLRGLASDVILQALHDSGGLRPEALFVGNLLAPMLSAQAHLGALLADHAGLRGIEAATLEAGGASGGAALRSGYMAVASGLVDVALVVGVEKFTDQIGAAVESALATSLDSDFEAPQGLTPHAQAALILQRYLHEFDVPEHSLAGFAVNAHANAAHNPRAYFKTAITKETYMKAGMVVPPLNLFDIAPQVDGAAAVVLTRSGLLPSGFSHRLVRISGSGMANDRLALHDRLELTYFPAAHLSMQQACRQAGITPGEADLFELYDSYSIYAALSLEAAGLAERGQGWKLAQDGQIGLDGLMPVSTFGGLKARGDAGGATGVYQAVEAVLQLRGQAGANQVPGAQRAIIQCFGGAAANAATHVLEGM
jgi:acetyl-CoA C-acetyltransferase